MRQYPLTFNEFKQGLQDGKLLGLRCLDCGTVVVPPGAVCTSCGSSKFERDSFARKGTIRTFTVIRVGPEGFQPPYVVAMVELRDGPYIVGNLVGIEPEKASLDLIGKSVSVGARIVPPESPEGGVEGMAFAFELE